MLTIEFKARALRSLNRIPSKVSARMLEKIEELAAAPRASRSWAKRLVGVPAVRVRQGDYRAICEIDEDGGTLTVLDVGHRREIYR